MLRIYAIGEFKLSITFPNKIPPPLKNAETAVEVSDSIYEVGEEVEIVRGPLKGFSGELCYFEKGKPMIGVYLELLGYACVSVNKNDVKSRNK